MKTFPCYRSVTLPYLSSTMSTMARSVTCGFVVSLRQSISRCATRTFSSAPAAAVSPGRAVYLDAQATTPTDPRVLDAMLPFYTNRLVVVFHLVCSRVAAHFADPGVLRFGNPHSRTHAYGWEAEAVVEKARAQGDVCPFCCLEELEAAASSSHLQLLASFVLTLKKLYLRVGLPRAITLRSKGLRIFISGLFLMTRLLHPPPHHSACPPTLPGKRSGT